MRKENKDIHRRMISLGDPGTDWRWIDDPVAGMIQDWVWYADKHYDRYQTGILDDGVLGEAWYDIGLRLRDLLNGELLVDAGTADGIIVAVFKNEGLDV